MITTITWWVVQFFILKIIVSSNELCYTLLRFVCFAIRSKREDLNFEQIYSPTFFCMIRDIFHSKFLWFCEFVRILGNFSIFTLCDFVYGFLNQIWSANVQNRNWFTMRSPIIIYHIKILNVLWRFKCLAHTISAQE